MQTNKNPYINLYFQIITILRKKTHAHYCHAKLGPHENFHAHTHTISIETLIFQTCYYYGEREQSMHQQPM